MDWHGRGVRLLSRARKLWRVVVTGVIAGISDFCHVGDAGSIRIIERGDCDERRDSGGESV